MIKKWSIILISATMALSSVNANLAQANSMIEEVSRDYKYPITPADDGWMEFTTHKEMVDHCQLSEEFLEKASTEDLLEAVLNYPLLIDLELYEDSETAIIAVAKQFNGLDELLKRKDFSKVLFDKYMDSEIPKEERLEYNNLTKEEKNEVLKNREMRNQLYMDYHERMETFFMETLFARTDVFRNYSAVEKKLILEDIMQKMKIRQESTLFENLNTSAFFQIVYYESKQNIWKRFIEKYYLVSASEDSVQFSLKPTYAVTLASDNGTTETYVKTPNKTKVKCIIYDNNRKNSDKFADTQGAAYPRATVVGNGYTGNNCHAYAWTGRQDIWMQGTEASKYVSDKSYVKIAGRPTRNGQKAVWGSFGHSGIVTDYSKEDPIITSKFGGKCIMKCNASYCPYDGSIVYYRRYGYK